MKSVIKHERLGEITYEESFWTGKKTLYFNGQELTKTARNVFQTSEGETVTLTGNFFSGLKANIGTESVQLTAACKWYEYVLSALPLVLILIWGNSVALCNIFPVVGGAIGGLIGGVFLALNMLICRKINNVILKVLICIATTGICFIICYGIALAILSIFS